MDFINGEVSLCSSAIVTNYTKLMQDISRANCVHFGEGRDGTGLFSLSYKPTQLYEMKSAMKTTDSYLSLEIKVWQTLRILELEMPC